MKIVENICYINVINYKGNRATAERGIVWMRPRLNNIDRERYY